MRKYIIILLTILLVGCSSKSNDRVKSNVSYSILKGMSTNKVLKTKKRYNVLVIDGSKFNKKQITSLHNKANYIYSYIDISAISTKDSDKYKNILKEKTISKKKYYVNVNDTSWQEHINDIVVKQNKLGIDGFFLDHLDIYKTDNKMYEGLFNIIKDTYNVNNNIILNNAMEFIEKDTNRIKKYIKGINQEDVFTYWNHETNQREDVDHTLSNNMKIYLENMKDLNKDVYIVDFTKKSDWQSAIQAYCNHRKMVYYFPENTSYSK